MICPTCPLAGRRCRGESYPRLCELADPGHPSHNPAYLASLPASDPQPEPVLSHLVQLAESLRLTKLAKLCQFRSAPSCSCEGAASCALKGGIDVTAATCWDCVGRYGA